MKRGKSTDRGYMLVGGRLTDDYGLGLLFQSQINPYAFPIDVADVQCSFFFIIIHIVIKIIRVVVTLVHGFLA